MVIVILSIFHIGELMSHESPSHLHIYHVEKGVNIPNWGRTIFSRQHEKTANHEYTCPNLIINRTKVYLFNFTLNQTKEVELVNCDCIRWKFKIIILRE